MVGPAQPRDFSPSTNKQLNEIYEHLDTISTPKGPIFFIYVYLHWDNFI